MRSNIRTGLAMITILILAASYSCDSDKPIQHVGRVNIYFVRSWHMTTTLPLNCAQLQSGEFPAQETTVIDSSQLAGWDIALKSLRPEPLKGTAGGDCRVCCLVYDARGQLMHTIALWPAGMKLDDSLFHVDRTLLTLIGQQLPHDYFPDSLQPESYNDTAL